MHHKPGTDSTDNLRDELEKAQGELDDLAGRSASSTLGQTEVHMGTIELNRLTSSFARDEARLPKHSVPAAMILELEALEDEIERLRLQPAVDSSTSQPQKQLP